MLKLKISQKTLLFFLAASLIPVAFVTIYWFRLSQNSLRAQASSQQSLLTSSAVNSVNQFITDKVNLLIIHSQTVSIQNFDIPNATKDLNNLIKQDANINEVTLADAKGIERASVNQSGTRQNLADISTSDAYKSATFLSGKEYISPVNFDSNQQPYIAIAVPLVTFDSSQSLSNLTTAELNLIRSSQAVKGVLVARISLSDLWKGVLSQKLGANGYAFVVDGQGSLIAHPDATFLAAHRDLSANSQVAAFIRNPDAGKPVTTMSETGVKVLSSYQIVPKTGWGVIAEQPTSSIYKDANRVAQIGAILFVIVAAVTAVLSYIFSKKLTEPIKKLAAGAEQISQGNLKTTVQINSKDEIGALAQSFNSMAHNLEALLRQARAESDKVNVILDNVGEGILAVDQHGVIMAANVAAAVLVGELPKTIIGKHFKDFYTWERGGKPFNPNLDSAMLYKNVYLKTTTGHMRYLDVLLNNITDDPMGIQTIFTVTDKTEEQELENMKIDFVSMAAHELRTPMTTIRGYLNVILDSDPESLPPQTRERLEHIQSNTTQLVGLINNLLNVSKIERGAFTLHLDKVDMAHIAADTVKDQTFSADTKGITLSFEGSSEPLYVLGDSIAMNEVVSNLVSNAINYTGPGGSVTVGLSNTEKGISVTVKDTGVGISENAKRHLFTKFYRVQNGLSSGSGGTGLGLYISKSIADMHKGTITCVSKEGEGSTFTFTLPHFDNSKYNEILQTRPTNLEKRRGWITQNITR